MSYFDWLNENWCGSCNTAHTGSCSDYRELTSQNEKDYQEVHKEKLRGIKDIGGLISYLNDNQASVFRDVDKAEEVLSVLYKLAYLYNKN